MTSLPTAPATPAAPAPAPPASQPAPGPTAGAAVPTPVAPASAPEALATAAISPALAARQAREEASRTWAITQFLAALVKHGGSDLHLKANSAPLVRVKGSLARVQVPALSPERAEEMIRETMTPETREKFDQTNEADYAIYVPDVGRFRVNAFRARGNAALIARHVAGEPIPLSTLGVPDAIAELAQHHRGLVLVTGPTGSGKTTTLSGMIDLINETRPCHILTLEDPIEVMHTDKSASVNQREMGADTGDFKAAMKAAMRQDPDVILIGEMRDPETVHAAVSAAQTGHFVMSTLHTTTAKETINRVIDFFEPHEQKQVRIALAQSLQGIVCQRLVPKADGQGRVCVMEILVMTEQARDAVMDPERTDEISDIIAKGSSYYGMQTFDQHLVMLVKDGQVTIEDAKNAANDPHDLGLMLKRAGISADLIDI